MNNLGKIEDAGLLVPGGRIDQHWQNTPSINPLLNPNAPKLNKEHWFHDSQQALEHFNLRSIEFGNWMNQQDRAYFLYGMSLGLRDLAMILNINNDQIGLGGRLSIAMGARGQSAAAGHYEPRPHSVINLTKTKGVGVLAHEFAHALDNAISFHTKSVQTYVSGGRTTRKGFDESIAMEGNWFEQEFEELFNYLFFDENGNNTPFHDRLKNYDDYWNRRNEIFARTFEVYVQLLLKEVGIKNPFLVLGAEGDPYPEISLVRKVAPLISKLIKKAFQLFKKETRGLHGISTHLGYRGFRKTLKENANLDDTLREMQRMARKYAWQIMDLAEALEGKTVKETTENIWIYVRKNLQYKLDKAGLEELRTPARSLVDGQKGKTDPEFGIDCDDYTILISAMLLNLGIPHEYRVTAYKQKGVFQHIYPVAFNENGEAFIIDCVPEIPHFNYEAQPIIDLKTVTMELQELSGITDTEVKEDLLEEIQQPYSLEGLEDDIDDELLEAHFLSGFGEVDTEEEADLVLNGSEAQDLIENGLLAEINKARQALLDEQGNPTAMSQVVNVSQELALMNEIMQAWQSGIDREVALEEAIQTSGAYGNFYRGLLMSLNQLDQDGLSGLGDGPIYLARMDEDDFVDDDLMDDEDLDGLGILRRRRRSRRKRGRLRNFFKKIGKGVKKAVKTVVRFNPATIATRAAILLVLKTNLFQIAGRLIYGYLSENQANEQGLDLNEWRKVVAAKNKAEKFFTNIGGKSAKFKNAIIKGRAAKKTGVRLNGLGIVATSATTAAAGGFIAFMKRILSKINPAKLFKGKTSKSTSNSFADPTDFNENISTPVVTSRSSEALPSEVVSPSNSKGMLAKIKAVWAIHKKKFLIAGVTGVVALVGLLVWKKAKKKKSRSLAGIKAARTRARNRRLGSAKKRVVRKYSTSTTKKKNPSKRKRRTPTLRGSTTILRLPSKTINKTRVSKRSNANRLKAMHQKAKQLQKKHPKSKYSTLLKKAAKMI